ncbi:hypothetical protein SKAU_G00262260 [Synaphobranchus kaupii]|uniref:Uncharacterized protein n=1 Tax=Synaphobranchus kaupii TaxID=118154 RepID=A0A9Q1EYM9_SYNKA|nr:hypothetical protein SKAU_G00262260 [Synaphobranchus kaupii]
MKGFLWQHPPLPHVYTACGCPFEFLVDVPRGCHTGLSQRLPTGWSFSHRGSAALPEEGRNRAAQPASPGVAPRRAKPSGGNGNGSPPLAFAVAGQSGRPSAHHILGL